MASPGLLRTSSNHVAHANASRLHIANATPAGRRLAMGALYFLFAARVTPRPSPLYISVASLERRFVGM